jgi:hypothetical protein
MDACEENGGQGARRLYTEVRGNGGGGAGQCGMQGALREGAWTR